MNLNNVSPAEVRIQLRDPESLAHNLVREVAMQRRSVFASSGPSSGAPADHYLGLLSAQDLLENTPPPKPAVTAATGAHCGRVLQLYVSQSFIREIGEHALKAVVDQALLLQTWDLAACDLVQVASPQLAEIVSIAPRVDRVLRGISYQHPDGKPRLDMDPAAQSDLCEEQREALDRAQGYHDFLPFGYRTRMWFNVNKTGWAAGPWLREPDKVQWKDRATGYTLLCHRDADGSWNGYVGLPESHTLYDHGLKECILPAGMRCDGECEHRPEPAFAYPLAYAGAGSSIGIWGVGHVVDPGEPKSLWWFGFPLGSEFTHSPCPQALRGDPTRYIDLAEAAAATRRLAERLSDVKSAIARAQLGRVAREGSQAEEVMATMVAPIGGGRRL